MQGGGRYFDGHSGVRRDVEVWIDAGALVFVHPTLEGGAERWPLAEVRALQGDARGDQLTVTRVDVGAQDSGSIDVPRLSLHDADMIAEVERACPALHTRDITKGTGRRIVTRLGLAAGALAVMLFVILPALAGTLAQIIPPEREAQWGRTIVTQIERFLGGSEMGQLVCASPQGNAALDAMLTRLSSNMDLDYALNITVFDHDMVNAFAAPGGQIVVMRGLLDAASSADEVAGVLAHEIGHVEARDATRNALRAAGSAGLISLVFGDFTGGALAVVLAETMLSASYTREAERAADHYALAMLEVAEVSSAGFADFFGAVGEMQGDFALPEYLATHPSTEGRGARADAFAATQAQTSPVLSPAAWAALRTICKAQ